MGLPYMPINWGGLGGQCRHIWPYMECLGYDLTSTGASAPRTSETTGLLTLFTPQLRTSSSNSRPLLMGHHPRLAPACWTLGRGQAHLHLKGAAFGAVPYMGLEDGDHPNPPKTSENWYKHIFRPGPPRGG